MKRIRNTITLLFLLLMFSPYLHTQTMSIRGRITGLHTVDYSMKLSLPQEEYLTGLISSNKTCRLVYEMRLYRSTHGIRSILGDSLLASSTHELFLKKDSISDQYIVDENGAINYFIDIQELNTYVTTIFGTFFQERTLPAPETLYLKGRCLIQPDVMEPPLKIIEIFFREKIRRIDWVTFSLDTERK